MVLLLFEACRGDAREMQARCAGDAGELDLLLLGLASLSLTLTLTLTLTCVRVGGRLGLALAVTLALPAALASLARFGVQVGDAPGAGWG